MKIMITLILLPLTMLLTTNAHAAKIAKVSGKKVYILLNPQEKAQSQDTMIVKDPKGKSVGAVKIVKVQGNKALGQLRKGRAQKGWSLNLVGSKGGKSQAKNRQEQADLNKVDPQKIPTTFYGVMGGFAINNMQAQIDQGDSTTKSADMSGNGFSGRAFFDYSLWPSIWFRGMLGLENLTASSDGKICGPTNNTSCEIEISYLTLDLWGRYLISQGTFRPWVGLGFNLLFPSSKVSTAIEEKSITSTSVIAPGLGFDWFIKNNMYIPVQLEYGMFPSSDTVKANYMAVRFGIAINF